MGEGVVLLKVSLKKDMLNTSVGYNLKNVLAVNYHAFFRFLNIAVKEVGYAVEGT